MIVYRIALFTILVLITLYGDQVHKECHGNSKEKLYGLGISFFHSVWDIYYYFGSFIFGGYIFHFILASINMIVWIPNRLKHGIGCPATYAYNKVCKIKDDDEKVQFRDILWYVNRFIQNNVHRINEIYFIIFVCFCILLYDFFKILGF